MTCYASHKDLVRNSKTPSQEGKKRHTCSFKAVVSWTVPALSHMAGLCSLMSSSNGRDMVSTAPRVPSLIAWCFEMLVFDIIKPSVAADGDLHLGKSCSLIFDHLLCLCYFDTTLPTSHQDSAKNSMLCDKLAVYQLHDSGRNRSNIAASWLLLEQSE